MACVANVDPSGRINVWTSTQAPYQIRATLAEVIARPMSRIRIIPMELGGGFGAKLRLCVEAYPVLLTAHGKPVKLIATREETFTLSGFRLPTIVYLKTGVRNDGTIVARGHQHLRYGAHLGAGVQSGVSHTLGPYNIPNYRMRSYSGTPIRSGRILPRLWGGRRDLRRGVAHRHHCPSARARSLGIPQIKCL